MEGVPAWQLPAGLKWRDFLGDQEHHTYPGPGCLAWAGSKGGGKSYFHVLNPILGALVGVLRERPVVGQQRGDAVVPWDRPFRDHGFWLWVIDEPRGEDPKGFIPYFDLEEVTECPCSIEAGEVLQCEHVVPVRERALAAIRWFVGQLEATAITMCEATCADLSTTTAISEATRLRGIGVKVSFHAVISIYVHGRRLLFPKRVLAELVGRYHALDPEHHSIVDHRVYNGALEGGCQLYRALGCAGEADYSGASILVAIDPSVPAEAHCPLPVVYPQNDGSPGEFDAQYVFFHTREWIERGGFKWTVSAGPLGRSMRAQVQFAGADPDFAQWLLKAVTERYQCVTGDTGSIVAPSRDNGGKRDASLVALLSPASADQPLEYVFDVLHPENDPFLALATLLPPDAIGGPGSGTYDVYVTVLMAATMMNARDGWIQFCAHRVPHSRCPDPAKSFDNMAARTLRRQLSGAGVAGAGKLVQLLLQRGVSRTAIARAHVEHTELADSDDEDDQLEVAARCVHPYVFIVVCPGPNMTYGVTQHCRGCGQIRTFGQLHRTLQYPNPVFVDVPAVADVFERVFRESLVMRCDPRRPDPLYADPLLLFVLVPCGLGKTTASIRWIRDHLRARGDGRKHVIIVPLVTCALVHFWASTLRSDEGIPSSGVCEVHHRSEDDTRWLHQRGEDVELPQIILTTPESLDRVKVAVLRAMAADPSYVLVLKCDEGSKLLQHYNSPTFAQQAVGINALRALMRAAQYIFFLDADITPWSIAVACEMAPFHRPVTLVNTHSKRATREALLYTKSDFFTARCISCIKKAALTSLGPPVYIFIFSTSKRFVDLLFSLINELAVSSAVRVERFTGENPVPAGFSDSVWEMHDEVRRVVVLILSPVVNAGVSLLPPAEVEVQLFMHARDDKPQVFIQQSQRLRCSVPMHVCVKSPHMHVVTTTLEETMFMHVKKAMEQNREEARSATTLLPEEDCMLLVESNGMDMYLRYCPVARFLYALLLREGMAVRVADPMCPSSDEAELCGAIQGIRQGARGQWPEIEAYLEREGTYVTASRNVPLSFALQVQRWPLDELDESMVNACLACEETGMFLALCNFAARPHTPQRDYYGSTRLQTAATIVRSFWAHYGLTPVNDRVVLASEALDPANVIAASRAALGQWMEPAVASGKGTIQLKISPLAEAPGGTELWRDTIRTHNLFVHHAACLAAMDTATTLPTKELQKKCTLVVRYALQLSGVMHSMKVCRSAGFTFNTGRRWFLLYAAREWMHPTHCLPFPATGDPLRGESIHPPSHGSKMRMSSDIQVRLGHILACIANEGAQ